MRIFPALLVILALAPATRAGTEPVPTGEALKVATSRVDEVFKDDIATAKRSGSSAALAQRLLHAASESANDPASQYVLYRLAASSAADGGDISASLEATDALTSQFAVDGPAVKLDIYERSIRSSRLTENDTRLLDRVDALINESISANHFDVAQRATQAGASAATRFRDPADAKWFNNRLKDIRQAENAFAAARAARDELAKDPTQKEPNRALGQYMCFVQGDWKEGLPHMVLGDDAELAPLAKEDLARPSQPEAQARVADRWWAIARKQEGISRSQIESHSAELYRAASVRLRGLILSQAEKRMYEAALNSPARRPFLATLQYWDDFGGSIANLNVGQTTHNNDDFPLAYVPDFLVGKPFNQLVGGHSGKLGFKVISPGRIFIFISLWSGYAQQQRPLLVKIASPAEMVVLKNQKLTYEIWSMTCEAGQVVNVPFHAMIIADSIEKIEHAI